jgi:hypothetical protein
VWKAIYFDPFRSGKAAWLPEIHMWRHWYQSARLVKAKRKRHLYCMTDVPLPALSFEELISLRELSKGDLQRDIPQLHWERLVALNYALRRLGVLGLTDAGIRRLELGQ